MRSAKSGFALVPVTEIGRVCGVSASSAPKVITNSMKSGEFEKAYKKWFQTNIPPKNVNLNAPMSKELKDNLKNLSDKPAL